MNINNNRQPSTIQSNNWKDIRDNLKPGEAIHTTDQVYIENRSKELEAEITTLSEKMKSLEITRKNVQLGSLGAITTFMTSITVGLLKLTGCAIPGSIVAAVIAAGAGSLIATDIVKSKNDHSICYTKVASENAKLELHFLKNTGQIWKPPLDYVGPGINNN